MRNRRNCSPISPIFALQHKNVKVMLPTNLVEISLAGPEIWDFI